MCAVSMIGDGYQKGFPDAWPWAQTGTGGFIASPPSRAEFEALRREVMELRELLLAAKKFDEATGQPDCEVDEKVTFLKQLAKMLDVDLSEVFGNE